MHKEQAATGMALQCVYSVQSDTLDCFRGKEIGAETKAILPLTSLTFGP